MLCHAHIDLPPQLRVLVVGDLRGARHLYGDLLGLEVLRDGDRGVLLGAGAPPVPALTLCPAAALRIDGSRSLVHALLAAQGGSWVQLATTDLDATLSRLNAYGAYIVGDTAERPDGARVGAALDPWDNTLRLVQRVRASSPPFPR